MATVLEDLPDEILLIISEYLSQKQIIRVFFGLNYRLDCMISQFFHSLIISNSNNELDGSSRDLLKIIGPYLRSLIIKQTQLSAEEMKLALNIEELTFIDTQPDPIPSIPHLTDLNIIRGPAFQSINSIFTQTNQLHSVHIGSNNPLTIPLFSPPKYSSIKQLSIMIESPKDFIRLLNACPQLTCLYLYLQNCSLTESIPIEGHSTLRIFSLRTSYRTNTTFNQLKALFQYLPSSLEQLSLEIETHDMTCVDGQVWEEYLRESFPQLNHIEFLVIFRNIDLQLSRFFRLSDVLKSFERDYWSLIAPQQITGYYHRGWLDESVCVHTNPIPIVQRRRFFLY